MNNLFMGIAAGGAVTAVAVLLLMQGRDEVRTGQELHRVESQIERAEFDEDFKQAWGGSRDSEKDARDKARLEALIEKRDELEASADTQRQTAEADTQALRAALEEQESETKGEDGK